jgi:hypothetical protein
VEEVKGRDRRLLIWRVERGRRGDKTDCGVVRPHERDDRFVHEWVLGESDRFRCQKVVGLTPSDTRECSEQAGLSVCSKTLKECVLIEYGGM